MIVLKMIAIGVVVFIGTLLLVKRTLSFEDEHQEALDARKDLEEDT